MATPIGANRARCSALGVAQATGGRLLRATHGLVACGITTDSRAVVQGGAFIALCGERLDGHAFVADAIRAGAVLVVVGRGRAPGDAQVDVVEVDDTLSAWGAIAKAHLREWRQGNTEARVVAITGSAGKTTTKELCAALLRTVGECHATPGNLNNRIGVPAVVLQLEARHRFAVLELGMSVSGEMGTLTAIVEPDVAMITNIGLAHAGGVGGTMDDVGREKGAIFAGVRPDGIVVANCDDDHVKAQLSRAPSSARSTSFGRSSLARYRLLERVPLGGEGSRLRIDRPVNGVVSLTLPIPGEAAALDLTAALAAAEAATAAPIDPATAMRTVTPIAGRMQVRRAGEVTVLDDAYNANPASMRAALATLGEFGGKRRVAVLGEMKELGPTADAEHLALADAVIEAGVALLFSCGGLAEALAREVASRGVEVVSAGTAEEASRMVVRRVLPGDVVLVKASRSVGAGCVVEALTGSRAGG